MVHTVICLLLAGTMWLRVDSSPDSSVFDAAFVLIIAEPATAEFLHCAGRAECASSIFIVDSVYTLDRFPFDRPIDTAMISIYRADMLRPLRAAYAPQISNRVPYWKARGVLFFSAPENRTVLAELFVLDSSLHSYEEYCVSSDGLKFSLQITDDGSVHLQRSVRLLR